MPSFVLTLWQLVWFSGLPLLQDSFGAALRLSKRISDFSGCELMFIVCGYFATDILIKWVKRPSYFETVVVSFDRIGATGLFALSFLLPLSGSWLNFAFLRLKHSTSIVLNCVTSIQQRNL